MKKILKFYSKTCGPCKVMSKALERLENIDIQEVDIMDENSSELVSKWKIRSVPTILVVDEDNLIAEFKGVVPIENIKKVINDSKI